MFVTPSGVSMPVGCVTPNGVRSTDSRRRQDAVVLNPRSGDAQARLANFSFNGQTLSPPHQPAAFDPSGGEALSTGASGLTGGLTNARARNHGGCIIEYA